MKTIDLRRHRNCPYLLQRLAIIYREAQGYIWARPFFRPEGVPIQVVRDRQQYRKRRVRRPRITENLLVSVLAPDFLSKVVLIPGFALYHDGTKPGLFVVRLLTPNGLGGVARGHANLDVACALALLERQKVRVRI